MGQQWIRFIYPPLVPGFCTEPNIASISELECCQEQAPRVTHNCVEAGVRATQDVKAEEQLPRGDLSLVLFFRYIVRHDIASSADQCGLHQGATTWLANLRFIIDKIKHIVRLGFRHNDRQNPV